MLVDSFTRTDHGTWELTPLRQFNDVLQVPALGLAFSLEAIYEYIPLDPIRLAYE